MWLAAMLCSSSPLLSVRVPPSQRNQTSQHQPPQATLCTPPWTHDVCIPHHTTPRHIPRHATPRNTTPHTMPHHATPHTTPRHIPRHATPHHATCRIECQSVKTGAVRWEGKAGQDVARQGKARTSQLADRHASQLALHLRNRRHRCSPSRSTTTTATAAAAATHALRLRCRCWLEVLRLDLHRCPPLQLHDVACLLLVIATDDTELAVVLGGIDQAIDLHQRTDLMIENDDRE